MFESIITQFLTGFSLVGILVIVAIGLAIIFGVAGVINMAHGEFIMVGAYTAAVVGEPKFTNQVQHRYGPELRWASTMTSSILMIVSRYPVCIQTGYLAARLAA